MGRAGEEILYLGEGFLRRIFMKKPVSWFGDIQEINEIKKAKLHRDNHQYLFSVAFPITTTTSYFASHDGDKFDQQFKLRIEKKFPYFQEVCGDEFSLFYAAFTAILHSCVGSKSKVQALKYKLKEHLDAMCFDEKKQVFIEKLLAKIPQNPTHQEVHNLLSETDYKENIVAIFGRVLLASFDQKTVIETLRSIWCYDFEIITDLATEDFEPKKNAIYLLKLSTSNH